METSSPTRCINVIIVEDESLYRDMLGLSLARDPDIRVIGTYAEPHGVLADGMAAQTDVALLDINLKSDLDGFELGLHLRRRYPRLALVFLSNLAEGAFI